VSEECGNYEEVLIRHIILDEERVRVCPKCGKKMTLTPFSFHWKFCEKGRYIQDREFSTDNPKYNYRLKKQQEKENAKV
jgi:hypothetical protein